MSVRQIITALLIPLGFMFAAELIQSRTLSDLEATSYFGRNRSNLLIGVEILWWLGLALVIRGGIRILHDVISWRLGRSIINAKFFWEIITVVIFFVIFLCVFVFVFQQDITAILATSGLVAAIIGLALQTTLSDAMSAMAINATKTFAIGDWLELEDGTKAQVIEMNWRTTRLRGYLRWDMVVPNHVMAKQRLNNFSQPSPLHDMHVDLNVDSCHPPSRVREVLLSAALSCPYIVKDDRCKILIQSMENNSVTYRTIVTLPNFADSYEAIDNLIGKLIDSLYFAGMSAYMPQFVIKDRASLDGNRPERIDDRGSLGRNPLFANFDPEEIDALMPELKLIDLQVGDVLLEEGDEGDSMFVVSTGLLGVYIMKDGMELEVNRMSGGDFFGEMSLLTKKPRSATIKALTSCRVFELTSKMLKKVFEDHPSTVEDLALAMESRIARQMLQEEQAFSKTKNKKSISGFEFARRILKRFKSSK